MTSVEAWLMRKGIAISASAVKKQMGIESREDLIRFESRIIRRKIDRLLQAPYKIAWDYLREGEYEKAKDRLKEAKQYEPLNVLAKLLHIYILWFQEKYEIALEDYWELMEEFSYRNDLFIPSLYEAYTERVLETTLTGPKGKTPITIRHGCTQTDENYYVKDFWCSPEGIAVNWITKEKFLWKSYDNHATDVFSWDGECLFSTEIGLSLWDALTYGQTGERVEMLTGRYFVVRCVNAGYRVYSLKDGSEVTDEPLTAEQFGAIFLPANQNIECIELYQKTRFSGEEARSAEEQYVYEFNDYGIGLDKPDQTKKFKGVFLPDNLNEYADLYQETHFSEEKAKSAKPSLGNATFATGSYSRPCAIDCPPFMVSYGGGTLVIEFK